MTKSLATGTYLLHRGLRRLFWGRAQGLRVLNYHYVNPATLKSFEAQLKFIKAHYHVVSLSQLAAITSEKELNDAVLITFDDGYEKQFRYAVPLLRQLTLPAVFFLCSDFVMDEERQASVSYRKFYTTMSGQDQYIDPLMTWKEARQLLEWGFAIGSHTATHPRLAELAAVDLQTELVGSKQTLEARLGITIDSFAIPYGHAVVFNTTVLQAIERAGYRYCFSNIRGTNRWPLTNQPLHRYALLPELNIKLLNLYLS